MAERLTQAQLADDYCVSLSTVRRAKADGVDVYKRQAFVDWVYSNKKRPHGWEAGVPWEQPDAENNPLISTAEEHDLMDQVRNAPNYDVARTLKTKIDSLMQIRKIQILENDYIHKDEVVNDLTRIGAAVLAAHKQCQADLPAMLEGLSAAKAKDKIRDYLTRIDGMLADETGRLYKTK